MIGCYYDQYRKGNLFFEHANIADFYKKDSRIVALLNDILYHKKDGYKNITLDILKEYLEGHIYIYYNNLENKDSGLS